MDINKCESAHLMLLWEWLMCQINSTAKQPHTWLDTATWIFKCQIREIWETRKARPATFLKHMGNLSSHRSHYARTDQLCTCKRYEDRCGEIIIQYKLIIQYDPRKGEVCIIYWKFTERGTKLGKLL